MEFNIVYRQNLHMCMGKHLFTVIVAVAGVVLKTRGWISNRSFQMEKAGRVSQVMVRGIVIVRGEHTFSWVLP